MVVTGHAGPRLDARVGSPDLVQLMAGPRSLAARDIPLQRPASHSHADPVHMPFTQVDSNGDSQVLLLPCKIALAGAAADATRQRAKSTIREE